MRGLYLKPKARTGIIKSHLRHSPFLEYNLIKLSLIHI